MDATTIKHTEIVSVEVTQRGAGPLDTRMTITLDDARRRTVRDDGARPYVIRQGQPTHLDRIARSALWAMAEGSATDWADALWQVGPRR